MMNIKRKVLFISLVASTACLSLIGCIACSNTSDDPEEFSQTTAFYFETNGVELDMYEKYNVPYVIEGTNPSITWQSSDSAVATVSDGVITGAGVGTATVTAVSGDFTAECAVKVYNSYTVPQIVLNDMVYVGIDHTLTLPVDVQYKGNGIDYSELGVSVVSGENVAGVSVSGNSLEVVGKSYGKAEFVISATANERTIAKTLFVECNDGSTVVVVENAKPTKGGWLVNVLMADDGTGNMTEFTPSVKVYVDGVETPKNIAWELSTGDVFNKAGNTYSPLKAGEQTLTGSFDGTQFKITLVAIRPVFEMSEHLVLELADEIKFSGATGTVSSVKVGETEVFSHYNAGTKRTTLDLGALSDPAKMGEGQVVTVTTDRAVYVYPDAEVYSDVITDENELNEFLPNAVRAKSTGDANGYFVLGENIKCTGIYKPYNDSAIYLGAGATGGFRGIFDGRGYTIDGLTVDGDRGGLVASLGSGGVLKNVVFTNAALVGNSAFIAANSHGEISNLYIEITMKNNDSTIGSLSGDNRARASVLVSEVQSTSVINKCMVVYQNTVTEGSTPEGVTDKNANHPAKSGHLFAIMRGRINDLVVVGHTTFTWLRDAGSPYTHTNVHAYASRAAMLADRNLSGITEKFLSSFWTKDSGGAPYPAHYPTSVLATPVLNKNNAAKTISWGAITGAIGYQVTFNNGERRVITGTQVDSNMITESSTVRVRAIAGPDHYSSNYAEVDVLVVDGNWADAKFVDYTGIYAASTNNASEFSVQGNFANGMPASVRSIKATVKINGEAADATLTFASSGTVKISSLQKGGSAYTPAVGDIISVSELMILDNSGLYYIFNGTFKAVHYSGTWYQIAESITLSIHPGGDTRAKDIILDASGGTFTNGRNQIPDLVKASWVSGGSTEEISLQVVALGEQILQVYNFKMNGTEANPGDQLVLHAGSVIICGDTKLAYMLDQTHTFTRNSGSTSTSGGWSVQITD